MIFQQHSPTFPLSNYVDSILYLNGNNKGTGLPKTAMSIVFNLNDYFKLFTDDSFSAFIDYKKYWVAGIQTRPNFVESYGQSEMIVIQFKTIGASFFLNQPLHFFTGNFVPLDEVFNREAEGTWMQLKESKTLEEKFIVAEKFLLRRMSNLSFSNLGLINSINLHLKKNEQVSIKNICGHYNISRKHLTHLFKTHAGVSPKLLSSLFRLQRTLYTLARFTPEKLTDLAYQEEYFDQAHFINDFKTFTGLKPTGYLALLKSSPSMKIAPHFLPQA